MSTYILLKDLPRVKAGVEYMILNDEVFYEDKNKDYENTILPLGKWMPSGYSRNEVENNPEWFKLKEEKPMYTVKFGISNNKNSIAHLGHFDFYNVNDEAGFCNKKFEVILKAIDCVVNKNGTDNTERSFA